MLITWGTKKKAKSTPGKQRAVDDGEGERYVQILSSEDPCHPSPFSGGVFACLVVLHLGLQHHRTRHAHSGKTSPDTTFSCPSPKRTLEHGKLGRQGPFDLLAQHLALGASREGKVHLARCEMCIVAGRCCIAFSGRWSGLPCGPGCMAPWFMSPKGQQPFPLGDSGFLSMEPGMPGSSDDGGACREGHHISLQVGRIHVPSCLGGRWPMSGRAGWLAGQVSTDATFPNSHCPTV